MYYQHKSVVWSFIDPLPFLTLFLSSRHNRNKPWIFFLTKNKKTRFFTDQLFLPILQIRWIVVCCTFIYQKSRCIFFPLFLVSLRFDRVIDSWQKFLLQLCFASFAFIIGMQVSKFNAVRKAKKVTKKKKKKKATNTFSRCWITKR